MEIKEEKKERGAGGEVRRFKKGNREKGRREVDERERGETRQYYKGESRQKEEFLSVRHLRDGDLLPGLLKMNLFCTKT